MTQRNNLRKTRQNEHQRKRLFNFDDILSKILSTLIVAMCVGIWKLSVTAYEDHKIIMEVQKKVEAIEEVKKDIALIKEALGVDENKRLSKAEDIR